MKKVLFILFILPIFIFGQDYEESSTHQNWRYIYGENGFYLYSLEGELIANESKVPDFTIWIQKDDGGSIKLRLDAESIYAYDPSGKKNYVEVEIIIDDSDVIYYDGEIVGIKEGSESRIYLRRQDNTIKSVDLFKKMKKGNRIYFRTTGAGEPFVYSYSLSGFTSGFNKLYKSWTTWNDQNKRKKNPFNYIPQTRQ